MLLRERVLAALNYAETQPLPYTLSIEDSVAQRLDHPALLRQCDRHPARND
jgi:hypothetical protein